MLTTTQTYPAPQKYPPSTYQKLEANLAQETLWNPRKVATKICKWIGVRQEAKISVWNIHSLKYTQEKEPKIQQDLDDIFKTQKNIYQIKGQDRGYFSSI